MDGRKSREVLLPFHKTPLGLCAKCKKSNVTITKKLAFVVLNFVLFLRSLYFFTKKYCVFA